MNNLWYNLSCHSQVESAFLFLSNSRLSARVPLDCDKHEKQQVGGSLIRGTMQTCTKCGKTKSLSEFKKDKRKKTGVGTLCKACASEYSRGWYSENIDKAREQRRKWYQKNGETWREKVSSWYAANKDMAQERIRKWRAANIEKDRKAKHQWYLENIEKNRKLGRAWTEANREKSREIKRRWASANPEKVREKTRNRRAQKRGNGGKITAQEWKDLKEFYNHTCLRCGQQEPTIKLTLDHVLPLKMGGKNVIRNAQPLCQSCNSIKGAKHIDYRNGRIMQ